MTNSFSHYPLGEKFVGRIAKIFFIDNFNKRSSINVDLRRFMNFNEADNIDTAKHHTLRTSKMYQFWKNSGRMWKVLRDRSNVWSFVGDMIHYLMIQMTTSSIIIKKIQLSWVVFLLLESCYHYLCYFLVSLGILFFPGRKVATSNLPCIVTINNF